MDVDVKNLRIVSGSADNKICVLLISSQVSVLNARRWVGHSTKFYTSTLLDSSPGAICLECNCLIFRPKELSIEKFSNY